MDFCLIMKIILDFKLQMVCVYVAGVTDYNLVVLDPRPAFFQRLIFGLRTVAAHRCLLDHMLICNLIFNYFPFLILYLCLYLECIVH